MSIEARTGDLFAQPDLTALAHGCNCAGAMGKGIAVPFKQR
jgi:O-acetyl-ADP-ribose deacetylase (regulator of RNase III)